MLEADAAGLDALLHDDLIYIHSSGNIDGKQSHIASVAEKTVVYEAFSPSNVRFVGVDGSTVLRTGSVRIAVVVRGSPKALHVAFIEVWTNAGGREWRMISWQSTSLPA